MESEEAAVIIKTNVKLYTDRERKFANTFHVLNWIKTLMTAKFYFLNCFWQKIDLEASRDFNISFAFASSFLW